MAKPLYCSFCGKSEHEVRKLIAGPAVYICDECVHLALDALGGPAADVLAERERQVLVEGYSTSHDDGHRAGEIALAAGCYAFRSVLGPPPRPSPYPWGEMPPSRSRRDDLVRAGALILAELQRLDRAEARP